MLAVQARIQALIPLLTAIRVSLIALVAIAWPWLMNGLHRWGRLDAALVATLLALRWRIVTWLVVIELVLGQNLLGQLLMAFQEG